MNTHPLTGDFNMYYTGTYIFRLIDGVPHTMMVEGTEQDGDDTQLDGVLMLGTVFNERENLGFQRWPASTMEAVRPFSGYFNLAGGADERSYLTWSVNNRTQRKGVDPRNALVGGRPSGLSGSQMCKVFSQSLEMNSRPGYRDIYIKDGTVHWKGLKVGTMGDSGYVANEQYKQLEVLICRLLQHI